MKLSHYSVVSCRLEHIQRNIANYQDQDEREAVLRSMRAIHTLHLLREGSTDHHLTKRNKLCEFADYCLPQNLHEPKIVHSL